MTSLSENEQKNEINIDSKQCASENEQSPLHNTTIIQETSHSNQEIDEKEQSNDLVHETEENKINNDINNDNAFINPSPSIVTPDQEEQQQESEATESTVNYDEDENRSKKTFHSNVKYSSISYRRSPYYLNEHQYGSASYYYYTQPSIDKPTPLMCFSTQQSSSTSRDNQTGNTATVSPQNLPPRLRQISTTESESNSQAPSTTPTTSQSSSSTTTATTTATTTNGRRHRSILPRGANNYYSPYPPPLMATPPGVLYTYPPAVHQPGHIAYNIRTLDELELLAFQQQFMNLPPPPIFWPPPPTALPPHGYPHFPGYPMNGLLSPSAYMFNNSTVTPSANSFLNPEAAEWVPPLRNDSDSSSDNQILIDDEINFPPLHSTTTNTQTIPTNIKDSIEDKSEQIDISSETVLTNNNNNTNDNPPISTDNSNISSQSNSNIESTNISSSSQDDNTNKPSSSSIKITPITYSTIISQTSENNKANKNNQQQQSTNHIHNQLPPRDRINKPQQQQRIQNTSSSPNINSRRRQAFNNNRNMTRNLLTSETNSLPKQQQQQQQQPSSSPISGDWIEVKSKKTKKFDRNINDNFSEKIILDEQIPKSLSPPLSLTSTGDNTTTTTFTSEDDFDEKDNNDLVIIMNNNLSNDYNQIIIDDIHRKLDNNEKLLIIMRGCPGSGKSTLAKSLNQGYNGVILSADDHFTDDHFNTYTFDPSKLDDAHRFNRRRASDALKRNISPIIIDNTNTQTWEMKPYAAMGKESGYDILIVEPQTPWRYKARELSKRNGHDVPLRRIKDMLSRFEHNIAVQNLLDKIPSIPKSNNFISTEQGNLLKDQENLDPILTSKKFYDIIDDSLILDDVRLCINDMILFLTSNFFQTTTSSTSQSSTSLSVSFHDLSLISSSASSSLPSTQHSRFHRPITRFPSTTNQDHTFNTEHILRLPTTAFSRCIDSTPLTPTLSTQSNNIGKKRRKNKTKQQANEILLNVNNNNNTMNDEQETCQQQQVFNVLLPEDCSDFIVIDEQNDNDWIDTVNKNFGIQMNSFRNHSSINPSQQKQIPNPKNYELINIIHTELTKPSYHSSISTKHIAIQCSSDDFNSQINHSDLILIGHSSSSSNSITTNTKSIPPRPGYNECGIQVDLNENNIELLINTYSNRLSLEMIEQFYEVCHFDIQWTCLQIDEYLENNREINFSIPTLQQLSLNKLNQWNEQIKSTNPLFDTKSINDLLEDINDEEIFEELILDNTSTTEILNSNQINIPWSLINSLEENYGKLPIESCLTSNNNGILIPFYDDLSINIYQALQRFLIKSDQTIKPVIENQIKKVKKKPNNNNNNNNQKWKLPTENQPNIETNTNNIPSLRQIINEEQQAAKSQKSTKKHQLDYATEHKLKELERHFPSFDHDLLYEIFRENEYDYDLTFICISTMFDENVSITNTQRISQPISSSYSNVKIPVEPVLDSYENLRHDALRHAQQRKEFYTKAQQANRHGMSGVASFYIHRASEETQLMKDANRAACERLSRWRLKQFYQTQRLDLHGLHSDEALNLFKQIEQELNEGNKKTTQKSIEIITGYGKNSVYGGSHGRIRSNILAYLQQKNYKYSEPNKGVILLQLTNARN